MEWVQGHSTELLGLLVCAYGLARAVVILTPTPKDDERLDEVWKVVRVIATIFGLNLKAGRTKK